MSHKKEINEPMEVKQAKNLELDEMPKPTRKASSPSIPIPKNAEAGRHDKIKGRRLVK